MRIQAYFFAFGIFALFAAACQPSTQSASTMTQLDAAALAIRDKVPAKAVIAHRGLPYWAPEETTPAFVLARDLGADYLEADLQRTKDGVIIALHDNDLSRTTNVAEVFPGREKDPVHTFTLEELKQLDAGSWFNAAYPDRARAAFAGLKILTLEELLDIAEGGDHRPGIYLETKHADMFPGIEAELYELLQRRGWVGPDMPDKPVDFPDSLVSVGYGPARVILQTFEKSSLPLLTKHFPEVPRTWLLWKGRGSMERADSTELEEWLDFGIGQGAQLVGPSIPGDSTGYANLMEDWMVDLIHRKGLHIHAYTFDTPQDIEAFAPKSEGQFVNRTELLLDYYGRPHPEVEELMARHGW